MKQLGWLIGPVMCQQAGHRVGEGAGFQGTMQGLERLERRRIQRHGFFGRTYRCEIEALQAGLYLDLDGGNLEAALAQAPPHGGTQLPKLGGMSGCGNAELQPLVIEGEHPARRRQRGR